LDNSEVISDHLPWPRVIALVDMNSFFASIEQMDQPELFGQPIAVTNGIQGTCIITCSYEARYWGIKTGMRLKEAHKLCPDLIQRPSRPKRYAEISIKIMQGLNKMTPDIEVYSVDEAFLDMTRCQKIMDSPEILAQQIKELVFELSGLPCSIGISGDKTTAKYAAKQNKPNGITIVHPSKSESTLDDVPVTDLCGIAKGIGGFLQSYGVYTCGDMKNIPISLLGKHFGHPGRRIWLMAQGKDPEKIHTHIAEPKSIGHGKVMPPNTKDIQTIKTYLQHMSEKVGSRLRRHNLKASKFYIGFRSKHGWLGQKMHSQYPTDDGICIMKLGQSLIHQQWDGEGISQIQVTAIKPNKANQQINFFENQEKKNHSDKKNKILDCINERYGDLTIAPSNLIHRSSMPDVIAPAWKPSGHRRTI
jgi:DNA polymerase-4